MYTRIKNSLTRRFAKYLEQRAKHTVQKNTRLWALLNKYLKQSPSTGCSYSDYLALYNHIRVHKPKEVLELGTGVSTVVIAQALLENDEELEVEGDERSHVTSMEENEDYYNHAQKLFPKELSLVTTIVLSPVVEDTYNFFRGVRYAQVPVRPYDFVFVDGPDYLMYPNGEVVTFCFDFIYQVLQSERPISAFIDTRLTTCLVYSHIFGKNFYYDPIRRLGIVKPVMRDDVKTGQEMFKNAIKNKFFRCPRLRDLVTGVY